MLVAFLAALAAVAEADPGKTRYEECVALVADDIEAGRAHAQQWAMLGGGPDARHCLAVADLAAGFPALSAARLEDLAERNDAGDDFIRARLLAEAAEAWLEAGKIGAAERAIAAAFDIVPDAGELHLTAAKVFAAGKRWQKASASVTAAEKAGFVSADAYVIRGRALAALGDYEAAAQDVVNALSLNPSNVDALVLRGDIQQTGVVIEVFLGDPEAEN